MKILDKIVSYLPTFNGKIITYEKEEDKNVSLEGNKENNSEVYKKGLMEGLQVNIYLLNNNKITKIANEAWNDIQSHQDPHKRQIMIKEQKLRQKENMFKNRSNIEYDSDNESKDIVIGKMNFIPIEYGATIEGNEKVLKITPITESSLKLNLT